MRVANLGGYRSENPPVGRVTEVPSGDLTIPLALNRWTAFEGCVRPDDEVAHTRNIVSLIRLCATHTTWRRLSPSKVAPRHHQRIDCF